MADRQVEPLVARPVVSVIIPVRDDAAGLRACLEALAAQDLPAAQREILVVDNGSAEDLSGAIPPGLAGVRVLREERPGSYAARNLGLRHAQGQVLAFTDADCRPAPDWLSTAVAALRTDPEMGAMAGRVEVFPATADRPRMAERYEMRFAFPQELYVRDHRYGVTANLVARREVMDRVGPFDATLASGGDLDWGRRAHAAGYRITYRPDVVVRHPARATLRELRAKARRTLRGAVRLGLVDPARGNPAAFWVASFLPRAYMLRRAREERRRSGAWGAWQVFAASYAIHVARRLERLRLRREGASHHSSSAGAR